MYLVEDSDPLTVSTRCLRIISTLQLLVDAKLGNWMSQSSDPQGGWPVREFKLSPSATATVVEISPQKRASVAVATTSETSNEVSPTDEWGDV